MAKFLRLRGADKVLLGRAALTVVAVRLGLWVLPFRIVRRMLPAAVRAPSRWQSEDAVPVERIAWAVRTASRYVPRASCLTQALAAQFMLGREGYPARLSIGVVKNDAGQLESHAWLESQGRIIIGDVADLGRFTPLPSLDGLQT